ncbi:MAG: hypothetical protein IRZ09_00785 [Variibacter sp.]|nr:hypothetical protein [Variibacter sp.]
MMKSALVVALAGTALLAGSPLRAAPLTAEEFRREVVGVPLCGTPRSGPFAGKALCTVHLPDGTAVVAGSGVFARGVWEADGGLVCRRGSDDAPERRRCIAYERLGPGRYRNSDGVEVCLGPCP